MYILNINSLSDIQLVNIGTRSVSCLFILLTLSFDAQVFKLMRINLSAFFIICYLGVMFKKFLPLVILQYKIKSSFKKTISFLKC